MEVESPHRSAGSANPLIWLIDALADWLSNSLSEGIDALVEHTPRRIYKYRRELVPVWASLLLGIATVAVFLTVALLFRSAWALFAGAALTLVVGAAGTHRVCSHWPRNEREQRYLLLFGGLATGWMASVWIFGPFHGLVLLAWAAISVAAEVPWLVYFWRGHVKVPTGSGQPDASMAESADVSRCATPEPPAPAKAIARIIQASFAGKEVAPRPSGRDRADRLAEGAQIREHFGQACKAVGMGEVNVMSITADEKGPGWTMRVQRPGLTVSALAGKLADLESHMDTGTTDTRVGALRVQANPDKASQVIVRYLPEDSLAEAVRVNLDPTPLTIARPFAVGLWDDLSIAFLDMLRLHTLVGGMTGGGKSSIINLLLFRLGMCTDVAIWGIDLKGGIELNDWEPRMDLLVTTSEDATRLLQAAIQVMEVRQKIVAAIPRCKAWPPSAKLPLLVIVIDEASELSPEAKELMRRVGQRGRALGVELLVATQQPSAELLGGTALRDQCGNRIAFHVTAPRTSEMILDCKASDGWRADRIALGGYFLLFSPEHNTPDVGRFYWLDEKNGDLEKAVELTLIHKPGLDPESRQAAESCRRAYVEDPSAEASPIESMASVDKIVHVLESAYPEEVSFSELLERTGLGRATLNSHLKTLELTRRVNRLRHGRYRLEQGSLI